MHGTQCVFSKLMQDENGNTALIEACQGGHVESARILLDHGANVDHQNNVSLSRTYCSKEVYKYFTSYFSNYTWHRAIMEY